MSTNRAPSTPTPQTQATPTQQAAPTASRLPDISRLTPAQKQQLITLIDQKLAKMPATKTAKPKVPYSAIQPTAQKISAPTNPGAPTSAEQAKLQQKIQAAMAAQQQP
jgi:hypothetical protein